MTLPSAADVIDAVIEVPVVTSFTNVGFEIRKRLGGWKAVSSYDLTGKVILLTGATSGLGNAAAMQLAQNGATLVLVGRKAERNQRTVEEIIKATGNAAITQVAADMGNLTEVRKLADHVLNEHDRLDVLIHNAGALTNERQVAPDGTESTIASQVVGPFLLTGLLLERLAESAPSRVITMSSGGMYSAKVTVDSLEMPADSFNGTKQYALAKRAQVTLNEMWAQQFGSLGITFHSMHPGWADTPGVDTALPTFSKVMGPLLRTAEQGADTLVWLAADPAALQSNGGFWLDRRRRDIHKLWTTKSSDTAERRERLWNWVSATADCVPQAGAAKTRS